MLPVSFTKRSANTHPKAFITVIAVETALKNYVYFFYRTGTSLFGNSIKTLTENDHVILRAFFKTSVSASALENHYFEQEAIAPEYAGMVSVVLQILEQEKGGEKLGR